MIKKFKVDEQDEDNIPETIDEVEVYAEPVMVEEKVSASDERRIAGELEGTPHSFDKASVKLLESLAKRGVAADFGESGWARGFRWHEFMRNS